MYDLRSASRTILSLIFVICALRTSKSYLVIDVIVRLPPAETALSGKEHIMSEKRPLLHNGSVAPQSSYTLVIHGGAGTMSKDASTPARRAQYKAALAAALLAGYTVLSEGGEAMDAAVAAVSAMEGMRAAFALAR